jgi:hypothetical protein
MLDDKRMLDAFTASPPSQIIEGVLERAIALAWEDIEAQRQAAELAFQSVGWSECVKNAWLRSVREAFAEYYVQGVKAKSIAVFGGKPRSSEDKHSVPSGIEGWRRWEFLYDVAVVAITKVDAAYARDTEDKLVPRAVPFVQSAIWLVESEVALNGTEIAIDASKLRLARSQNLLFIAAQTGQNDRKKWLRFLGEALAGCEGNVFLALIPSYASGNSASQHWQDKAGEIAIYRCGPDGSPPTLIKTLQFSPG